MSQDKPKFQKLSAKGMRFAIVVARYNSEITDQLLKGAVGILSKRGASGGDIAIFWVPGAFELPLTLKSLAKTKKYDALIALGAVIRGDTPHFEYVCQGATQGIQEAMLQTDVPIAFGLLTTNNKKEAIERIGGKEGHKGEEAARVAIEMAHLMKRMRS